jgi:hypothetical protein
MIGALVALLAVTKIRAYTVPEAVVSVVADEKSFFVVEPRSIVKYRQSDGKFESKWLGDPNRKFQLRSGVRQGNELVFLNAPSTGAEPTIELFDLNKFSHVASIPLPGQEQPVFLMRGEARQTVRVVRGSGSEWDVETVAFAQKRGEWTAKLLTGTFELPSDLIARLGNVPPAGGALITGDTMIVGGRRSNTLVRLRMNGGKFDFVDSTTSPSEGNGMSLGADGNLWQADGLTNTVYRLKLSL